MSKDKHLDVGTSRKEQLAGPASEGGSPEEYAGFGEFGEYPEMRAPSKEEKSPMKFKVIDESGAKTFALVFEKDDEVIRTLRRFATEQRLLASHFTAIGAFSNAVLGFFDPVKKQYNRIVIPEQVEVLSLNGDITFHGDEPTIHAHVVVGKSDGTAHGGHLMEAHVFPTLELIVVESPKSLKRRLDEETGLPLIDLDAA